MLATLRTGTARARLYARRPVARTPYLWDVTQVVRAGKLVTLARRDSAIVIEGFMRSGNTFSVAAFEVANGPRLHVARHLHGAAHVLRAARLGLPTVVLIRSPRDAVLSYLVRRDEQTSHAAVVEYLDFYRTVWRVRDHFVVGLFDQVTTDFGSVLDEVNQRFGTSFRRFEHTPENEAAAFRLVEEMNRQESGGEVRESHVGRPSEERARRKEELRASLDRPRTAARLRAAEELFREYVELASDRAR